MSWEIGIILGGAILVIFNVFNKHRIEKRLGKKMTWVEFAEWQKQEKENRKEQASGVDKEVAALTRIGKRSRVRESFSSTEPTSKEQTAKRIPIGSKHTINSTSHGIQFEAQLFARENTEDEDRIRELHLQATKHKGKKKWAQAVACLEKAKMLMDCVDTEYPLSKYLRLPLFLQQAGRIDEAVIEFENLLDQFHDRHEQAIIYDKMRLSFQREKDYKQAVVYGTLYAELEFLNKKAKDEYMKKVIQPLYSKAQDSVK